jgi:proton-dependent oligopeptide transporter, POT family
MKGFRTKSAPHRRSPARHAGTDRIHTTMRDFLGHPRGLTFLFTTEMWERFSYYGMRALLVLYMVKYLLLPGHDHVIGLGAIRGVLESMFGSLGVQPFASQIYGLYTGFVYLTPLFGGWLADHALGQRRAVILGAALMAIGHFMMAFESDRKGRRRNSRAPSW